MLAICVKLNPIIFVESIKFVNENQNGVFSFASGLLSFSS